MTQIDKAIKQPMRVSNFPRVVESLPKPSDQAHHKTDSWNSSKYYRKLLDEFVRFGTLGLIWAEDWEGEGRGRAVLPTRRVQQL